MTATTNKASSDSSAASPLSAELLGVSEDCLFSNIEKCQIASGNGFGKVLDAGTGSHSLKWIASLLQRGNDGDDRFKVTSYTAITADESMRRNVAAEAKRLQIHKDGEVIIGNWFTESSSSSSSTPNELCAGEVYDVILADYLVGAMDGFSPYYQDLIFDRLKRHLKPGGRIYVVGLNPIPDKVAGDADVFCRVTRLRDACILMAGNRCYREYPVEWIERHLEKSGLNVVQSSKFPIMYSHETITRQLNVARAKLPLFPSKTLAAEMGKQIDSLEEESRKATQKTYNGRLKIGFDYVVSAELPLSVEGGKGE